MVRGILTWFFAIGSWQLDMAICDWIISVKVALCYWFMAFKVSHYDWIVVFEVVLYDWFMTIEVDLHDWLSWHILNGCTCPFFPPWHVDVDLTNV